MEARGGDREPSVTNLLLCTLNRCVVCVEYGAKRLEDGEAGKEEGEERSGPLFLRPAS
jgi:hypothetical protein